MTLEKPLISVSNTADGPQAKSTRRDRNDRAAIEHRDEVISLMHRANHSP